jgi:transcriptional regulator with XRE-family HTH domain
MDNNDSPLAFGDYLKQVRVEKKISLAEISAETRIRVDILLSIERGDHSRLPAEVFVKGFVRAYAKAVGTDENEALARYLASFGVFKEHVEKKTKRSEQQNFWYRLLFSIGMLLCVIVVSVYFISSVYNTSSDFNENKRHLSDATLGESHIAVDPFLQNHGIILPDTKNFQLEIIAIKQTWIKVMIDNLNTKEYSLNPGDQIALEAKSGFNILVGNADGVTLFLNKNPVVFSGTSGHMVSLQLP